MAEPRYASLILKSRRVPVALAFLCLALSALGAPPAGDPVADAIAKARHLPARDALKMLQRLESQTPHRAAELLAQISMTWSDAVEVARENHEKIAAEHAARRAYETAEHAIKADPDNARAHLSLAIAAGGMTDYAENGALLALSKRVRDEAERAIALDPKESGGYYILGRWYFGVATVNPVLKFAARMVIGALPPASLKDAAKNLEKAVALSPNDIEYRQHLALVYKATGKKDKAAQQWHAILKLPSVERTDERAKGEASAALGK